MYESRKHRPLARRAFVSRLLIHLAAALVLLAASLLVGMFGYMRLEQLAPIDAFLNSAMLLGGMGPVDMPSTPAGNLFAGAYAIYAGLFFLVSAALILTPIAHRMLHRFHWDTPL